MLRGRRYLRERVANPGGLRTAPPDRVAVAAKRVGERADVNIDVRRHHPFEKNRTGRIPATVPEPAASKTRSSPTVAKAILDDSLTPGATKNI